MNTHLQTLVSALEQKLGERASIVVALGEVTITVKSGDYYQVMQELRDDAALRFDTLIDLCGVDYSTYGEGTWDGLRFAAVTHLLSVEKNWRLRVRVFAPDDDMPILASVTTIWRAANWFEREAFDLFGIIFEGHNGERGPEASSRRPLTRVPRALSANGGRSKAIGPCSLFGDRF